MKEKVEQKPIRTEEFPDTIYVIVVDLGSDDECVIVSKTPDEVTEGDTGNVAVYKLARIGKKVVTIS